MTSVNSNSDNQSTPVSDSNTSTIGSLARRGAAAAFELIRRRTSPRKHPETPVSRTLPDPMLASTALSNTFSHEVIRRHHSEGSLSTPPSSQNTPSSDRHHSASASRENSGESLDLFNTPSSVAPNPSERTVITNAVIDRMVDQVFRDPNQPDNTLIQTNEYIKQMIDAALEERSRGLEERELAIEQRYLQLEEERANFEREKQRQISEPRPMSNTERLLEEQLRTVQEQLNTLQNTVINNNRGDHSENRSQTFLFERPTNNVARSSASEQNRFTSQSYTALPITTSSTTVTSSVLTSISSTTSSNPSNVASNINAAPSCNQSLETVQQLLNMMLNQRASETVTTATIPPLSQTSNISDLLNSVNRLAPGGRYVSQQPVPSSHNVLPPYDTMLSSYNPPHSNFNPPHSNFNSLHSNLNPTHSNPTQIYPYNSQPHNPPHNIYANRQQNPPVSVFENTPTSSNNSSIVQDVTTLLSNRFPIMDIEKFDGKAEKYESFRIKFKTLIDNTDVPISSRARTLFQALGGDVVAQLDHIPNLNQPDAYDKLWTSLDAEYGRFQNGSASYITELSSKLQSWPSVRTSTEVYELYKILRSYYTALEQLNQEYEMEHSSIRILILGRLTGKLLGKCSTLIDEHPTDPVIKRILDIMKSSIRIMNLEEMAKGTNTSNKPSKHSSKGLLCITNGQEGKEHESQEDAIQSSVNKIEAREPRSPNKNVRFQDYRSPTRQGYTGSDRPSQSNSQWQNDRQTGSQSSPRRDNAQYNMEKEQRFSCKCIFCCSNDHDSAQCTKLDSPKEYKDILFKFRLCFNCLHQNHGIYNCYLPKQCSKNCSDMSKHATIVCSNQSH